MGRLAALILGLAALALLSVGIAIVVGWGVRYARRFWRTRGTEHDHVHH